MARYIYCSSCTLDAPALFQSEEKKIIVGNSKDQTQCGRCGHPIRIHDACAQILTAGDRDNGRVIPVDKFDPIFAAREKLRVLEADS